MKKVLQHIIFKKVTIFKWQLHLIGIFFTSFGIVFSLFVLGGHFLPNIFASGSATWTQTDWSGGVGPSTADQYSGGSNIDATATAGQVTLSKTSDWSSSYTAWAKRQTVTITNTGSEQTDYQVRIPVTYDSDMQANFNDLRFTNSTGTALNFWVQTATNSTSAVVWVKIDTLAASGDTIIYMYYGNAAASSASSGANTFSFFDDFNAGTLDGTKWTKVDPRSHISVGSGKLQLLNGSGSGGWDTSVYAIPSFTRDNWSLEFDLRWTSDYSPYDAMMWGWKDDGGGVSYANLIYGHYNQGDGTCSTNCDSRVYESGNFIGAFGTISNNTDYVMRERMRASGGHYYEKSTNNGSSWTTDYTSAYSSTASLHPAWMLYAGDYLIDNVRVRKWMTTEPTPAFGSETNQYQSPGTLTSNILDTGVGSDWGNLTYTATVPSNTTVSVKVRAGNSADLSDATAFSSCTAVTSGTDLTGGCTPDNKRYVQYQITLSTTDTATTPTFQDVSIEYGPSDIIPPDTNASAITMRISSGGRSIASNDWDNSSTPYFAWTAGADNSGGVGLLGYCLYLGSDSAGNPSTSKGLLGTTPTAIPNGSTCQFITSSESIDLTNSSYHGATWLTSSNSPYYLNVKAIDRAGNVYAGSSAQFQFKFDGTAPTNVAYISAASGSFGNVTDMNFNWPISGGSAASDSNSDVLGYQYQLNGSSGTWLGTSSDATCGVSYIPKASSSYTFTALQDENNVVTGANVIYFRAVDTACNMSSDATIRTASIIYGGAAPTFLQTDTVTVSPSTSDTNSFALSWPAATPSGVNTIRAYYYIINNPPPSTYATLSGNSSTYISTGTTRTVSASALPNVNKGTNTVYVVAVDNASTPNYSPSNYITGTFTLNSTNPDNVGSLVASDSSIKSQSQWNVTLTWTAPTYQGAGNLNFIVKRSADGATFAQVGTTSGNSYVDNAPESKTYYYKIYTKDGANALSSGTNAVEETPTGHYTSAPGLESGPTVSSVTTKKATISWSTDRKADSKVSYGTSSGKYNDVDAANSDLVTSHSITLINLAPGTTYYYKVKWTDEDGNSGTSDEKNFSTDAAPVVTDPKVKSISLISSVIEYTVTGASKVKFYYGKSTSFGAIKEVSTSTSASTYTTSLEDLEDGTKYYYKINTFDSEGSEYEGSTLSFETLPRPKLSNIRLQEIKGSAQPAMLVTWNSNTEVSSIITYYPEGAAAKGRDEINIALKKGEHKMVLKSLFAQTNYILVVKGRDKAGNEALSDSQKFTTSTDTRPPQISNLKTEGSSLQSTTSDSPSTSQLVISWDTDEASTSQVEFGEGTGNTYSQKTQEDTNYTTNHVVIISNLTPSKVYHLRSLSRDKANNQGKSIDTVTITPQSSSSALDLVIGNLGDAFKFLNGNNH